ncbi:GNAT family N-acetyltransferase [Kitasatospora sp. NPDC051914]|uniref:GNAT family N-acetyltransferase n=1 Tax=Kitasatospora sp. NPDC051914 TaxID=3154945 RepID=UPI00344A2883
MSLASPATWTVTAVPVDHPDSVPVLRAYMDELISRYYGRPAEEEEIAALMADNADLLDDRGILLLARAGATPVACIGIRWIAPGTGELTRVFVTRDARRGGAGRRLVGAAEDAARERGATRILLNTRKDLTEAIALYTALGYRPTDPYGDDPYAELWLAKDLG